MVTVSDFISEFSWVTSDFMRSKIDEAELKAKFRQDLYDNINEFEGGWEAAKGDLYKATEDSCKNSTTSSLLPEDLQARGYMKEILDETDEMYQKDYFKPISDQLPQRHPDLFALYKAVGVYSKLYRKFDTDLDSHPAIFRYPLKFLAGLMHVIQNVVSALFYVVFAIATLPFALVNKLLIGLFEFVSVKNHSQEIEYYFTDISSDEVALRGSVDDAYVFGYMVIKRMKPKQIPERSHQYHVFKTLEPGIQKLKSGLSMEKPEVDAKIKKFFQGFNTKKVHFGFILAMLKTFWATIKDPLALVEIEEDRKTVGRGVWMFFTYPFRVLLQLALIVVYAAFAVALKLVIAPIFAISHVLFSSALMLVESAFLFVLNFPKYVITSPLKAIQMIGLSFAAPVASWRAEAREKLFVALGVGLTLAALAYATFGLAPWLMVASGVVGFFAMMHLDDFYPTGWPRAVWTLLLMTGAGVFAYLTFAAGGVPFLAAYLGPELAIFSSLALGWQIALVAGTALVVTLVVAALLPELGRSLFEVCFGEGDEPGKGESGSTYSKGAGSQTYQRLLEEDDDEGYENSDYGNLGHNEPFLSDDSYRPIDFDKLVESVDKILDEQQNEDEIREKLEEVLKPLANSQERLSDIPDAINRLRRHSSDSRSVDEKFGQYLNVKLEFVKRVGQGLVVLGSGKFDNFGSLLTYAKRIEAPNFAPQDGLFNSSVSELWREVNKSILFELINELENQSSETPLVDMSL